MNTNSTTSLLNKYWLDPKFKPKVLGIAEGCQLGYNRNEINFASLCIYIHYNTEACFLSSQNVCNFSGSISGTVRAHWSYPVRKLN